MLRKIFVGMVLFAILTGCMNGQTEDEKENTTPTKNLSTEQSPDYGVPNMQKDESNLDFEWTQSETSPGIEKNRSQASLQETIPDEIANVRLPYEGFKERWNAISEEQMSQLYIDHLEEITDADETFHSAQLTDKLELRIYSSENVITKLEMISNIHSKQETFSMLSGWNQMIIILHPNNNIRDVDNLFSKFGVGPDADMSNVKNHSFDYANLHYNLEVKENVYIFSATYKE